MILLLDTHAFLWSINEPNKLSTRARQALLDTDNDVMLSVVSIWEMQIKTQLGKLHISAPLSEIIKEQVQINRLFLLPLIPDHVYRLNELPMLHTDPFDRLLICQSQAIDAAFVTQDGKISQYIDSVLW